MNQATRLAIMMSILAIAVRLILIDQPYIDNWSWRQSDVAAIARNYFEGGFDFARPQIDWAGDQPGYVGTEFPILPFVAALCYKIFGVHEWIGRSQAVILFALSLPFFFLLVRKIFGEVAAVWALFFYSFAPLGIMASRCFMPDTPSLALSIIGLYLFDLSLQSELDGRMKSPAFFASAVCISLSILIKATSIIIVTPLLALVFQRFRIPPLRLGAAFRNFSLWLFAAIALLPSALWYAHAYQISLQFYPHHFFGAGGIRIMPLAWYFKIAKLLVTSTLTPFFFILGVAGAVITASNRRGRTFHWWLAAMILFIVVVGYGNRHQWYQLQLVPIFAAFAGAACELGTKIENRAAKIATSILLAGIIGADVAVYVPRFYQPSAAALRNAGLELKRNALANALIVAADNGDPTLFYYAERKGWHFLEKDGIYDGEPKDGAQAIVDLEQLRKRGANYFVATSNTAWWLDYYRELGDYIGTSGSLIAVTPEFKIYELKPSR